MMLVEEEEKLRNQLLLVKGYLMRMKKDTNDANFYANDANYANMK